MVKEWYARKSGATSNTRSRPLGDADFVTFINQQRLYWDENSLIISEGNQGDVLTYINETSEISEIYNRKEKTTTFLSIDNPEQYIKPGKCLVNTINYKTMVALVGNNERTNCSLRLFCGTEMKKNGFYAIELCGIMASY